MKEFTTNTSAESPVILGIDPGGHCGWAVMNAAGKVLECGTWQLVKDKERYGVRAARFKGFVEHYLSTHDVTHIAYELVRRHIGTDAAHVYGGLQMILEMIAYTWDLPCTPIPVATIKQTATGKGNAQKAEMVVAACRKWPKLDIKDDNLPDALFVAETQRQVLAGSLKLAPKQPRKKRQTA